VGVGTFVIEHIVHHVYFRLVRDQAFKTIELFLKRLAAHAESMVGAFSGDMTYVDTLRLAFTA
jgi:hypothetical protein